MKHLSVRDDSVSDEHELAMPPDPQSEVIHRAFLRAHGQSNGLLSTLTSDRRVQIEVRNRGVPTA